MQKIPLKLREELSKKKFYEQCAICYQKGVQWHHNLIFAGKQVNEEFCIIPLCPKCHDQARNTEFKKKLDWIMWNRATKEQIQQFSKAINYSYVLTTLNDIFGGTWKNPFQEE